MEYKRPPLGRLSIIQFSQEVFTMTSWAVQPSSWGNELKANAEFGHSFDRIQDIALDWATDQSHMDLFNLISKHGGKKAKEL